MKYTLIAVGVLFGIMGSVSVAATANGPIGSFACIGNAASGNKPFKGTLTIAEPKANGHLYSTLFTYDNGAIDVGTLKAAKVANTYIQRWHAKGRGVAGLSQYTMSTDGQIAIQYVLIERTTGQFTSGAATCKPVVAK